MQTPYGARSGASLGVSQKSRDLRTKHGTVVPMNRNNFQVTATRLYGASKLFEWFGENMVREGRKKVARPILWSPVLGKQLVQNLSGIVTDLFHGDLQATHCLVMIKPRLVQKRTKSPAHSDIGAGYLLPQLPNLFGLVSHYCGINATAIKTRLQSMKQLGVETPPRRVCRSLDFRLQFFWHTQRIAGCLVSICSHPQIVDIKLNRIKESY